MGIEVTFLGTSCSTPTKGRNLSSLAITHRGAWYLFDTPEGVQQQLMRNKLSHIKLKHIFISHFHGDHTLGLPGLLATMGIHERTNPLTIFGPKGIGKKVKQAIDFAGIKPVFQIFTKELKEGKVLENTHHTISCVKLNHSIACFGFIFETKGKEGTFQRNKALKLEIPEGPLWSKLQKGKNIRVKGKTFTPKQVMDYSKKLIGTRIGFVTDTSPHSHYIQKLKNVDVLIHEASFCESEKERAVEVKHSTAKMAAEVAKKVKAKELILTHFSPRYADGKEMLREARKVFRKTSMAEDLKTFSFADRKSKKQENKLVISSRV
jgi:ribonuclease Z